MGKTAFDTPYQSEPFERQAIDTTVAEFGISCESCHGPGQAHVEANRNPLRRYALHLAGADGDGDPTIVLPTRLDPQRSSQVCGQCHSVWEFYDVEGEREANRAGLPYRPGHEIRDTRFVIQPSMDRGSDQMLALIETDPEFVRGSFWPDGLVRVSGREYNGLIDSPCFRDATEPEHTLTCFSCHTLHKTSEDPRTTTEWADTHQISTDMNGNGGLSAVSRSGARRRHRPYAARGGFARQQLLQLPHALHQLRTPDGGPEPHGQQSDRDRNRGAWPPERL